MKAPAGSSGWPPPPSVPSVSPGQRRHPRGPGQRHRQGERIFLVGAAAALAAQRHGQLAARQDHGATSLGLEVARHPCVGGGDVARLAFDLGAEQDRLVARRPGRVLDGNEDVGGPHRQRERACGRTRRRRVSASRWRRRRARGSRSPAARADSAPRWRGRPPAWWDRARSDRNRSRSDRHPARQRWRRRSGAPDARARRAVRP